MSDMSNVQPIQFLQQQQQGVAFVQHPCPTCQRDFGAGLACQFCDQVSALPIGVQLSSASKRIGGYLLEGLLILVTLGIGWLIWAAITFSKGQTPAKQVLGMRVVSLRTSSAAGWGTMFVREFITKTIGGFLGSITLGILNFMMCWDRNHQEVWDKMSGTIVVNDSNRQLV